MPSSFAVSVRSLPLASLFEAVMRAALVEASALLHAQVDPDALFEPDRWSAESDFLDPGWPR
jgi:hypothetical protein